VSGQLRGRFSGVKKMIEDKGYSDEVGADGYYVDPRHPTNK